MIKIFRRKLFWVKSAFLLTVFYFSSAFSLPAVELPDEKTIQENMDALVDSAQLIDEKAIKYAEKQVLKGMKSHTKGRYLKAIQHYKKAINQVPIFGAAYYELALTQYNAKQYKEAYISIVRALVMEPGLEMAHIVKASILDDAGYSSQAIMQLRRLVDINPNSFLAWLNLGVSQLKQERFADAEQAFLSANQLDPNNPSTAYFLFICVSQQGFSYEEEKWIEKFLSFSTEDDPRRELATKRLQELQSVTIYLDPESPQPELDLLEAMTRRQWFLKKHREAYPSERGYKPSLSEEVDVAQTLLGFIEMESELGVPSERIGTLKTLRSLGYLKAYFYFELQDQLGEKDLRWAENNKSVINRYLSWQKTQNQLSLKGL